MSEETSSSEQVFDYRDYSTPEMPVYILAWIGVAFLVFGIPIATHDELPSWLVWTQLGIAIILSCCWIRAWLVRQNERIVISDGELIWFDLNGTARVRVPLSHVLRVKRGRSPKPFKVIHQCRVQTGGGTFVFDDRIHGFAELTQQLLDAESRELETNFSYRRPAVVASCLICLLPASIICLGAWYDFLIGHVDSSGLLSQYDFGPFLFANLLCSGFLTIGIRLLMSYRNERIIATDEDLIHYDYRGVKSLDISIDEVVEGSFVARFSVSNPPETYSVETPQGKLVWTNYISDCDDLATRMKAASEGAPPKSSQEPWTSRA